MDESQVIGGIASLIVNAPPSIVSKGCTEGAILTIVAVDLAEYLVNNGVMIILETEIGDFSDGYHTFNELYHHRAILFSIICNACPEKAWKSKLHDTGDMYDGMFIVGIETPRGQATYHYNVDPYWDLFQIKELERAPKWDGHTPAEAIERIRSLVIRERGEWLPNQEMIRGPLARNYTCPKCGHSPIEALNFCSLCGADMRGVTDTNVGGKWIPVTERLPIKGSNVLIYSKSGGRAEGELCEDGWWQYRWCCKVEHVTHWMPLPEPPEAEKGGAE